MRSRSRLWVVLSTAGLTLSLALGPGCADDGAADESSTEDSGSSEEESGQTDTDTDTSTDTGGLDTCEAPDDEVYFSYEPFMFGLDAWDADVDWTCTVDQVDTSDGLDLSLDCPMAMQAIEIDLRSSPAFVAPLVGGETIQLRFVSEGPFWFNEYLRLDVEGHGHLLTIINGDGLLPPETYDFEHAHEIKPVYEACAREMDFCGELERLPLSFEISGEAHEVLDGHHDLIGPSLSTQVWAVEAGHLHEIECTDTPDEWFRVLIVDASEP